MPEVSEAPKWSRWSGRDVENAGGAITSSSVTPSTGATSQGHDHETVDAAINGSPSVLKVLAELARIGSPRPGAKAGSVPSWAARAFCEGGRRAVASKGVTLAARGIEVTEVVTLVEAVLMRQTTVVEAAANLGVTTNTMTRHKAIYVRGGRQALESEGLGRGERVDGHPKE